MYINCSVNRTAISMAMLSFHCVNKKPKYDRARPGHGCGIVLPSIAGMLGVVCGAGLVVLRLECGVWCS